MRYITVLLLLVLSASGRAQNPISDIHGTWTAELRSGRVFLQLRTPAPEDQRGRNGNGDWSMGQTFPVEDLSGLPANDERLTAGAVKG